MAKYIKKKNKKNRQGEGGGQPTKYTKEARAAMKKLYPLGLTDAQVGDVIGVTTQVMQIWKEKYPKFFAAIKDWKIGADGKVVKSLYQRACGYQFTERTEEDIFIGETKTPGTKKKTVIKEVPADTTAIIFWLCNRHRETWKRNQTITHELPENLIERYKNVSDDDLRKRIKELL